MDTSTARLFSDIAGLDRLKARARTDQAGAVGEVAKQFEGLLVQMMIKSMRQASLGEGLLDSRQSLFYRDLYDQQLALHMADKGLGLAEVIERQLAGGVAAEPARGRELAAYRKAQVRSVASAAEAGTEPAGDAPEDALDSPQRFVAELWPWAEEAGRALGLVPEALLAQAALETGWGHSVIQSAGSASSHNLFGIKADGRWDGARASVSTLEYQDGVAVRRRDPFRVYDSYRESFRDYVDFVRGSSRYREAVAAAADPRAYFDALQRGGYATDPAYADKVMAVLEGTQMRAALQALQAGDAGDAAEG